MYLPILFSLMMISCSFNMDKDSIETNQHIVISDIVSMPEDIEGCACYLSKDDSSFEDQKHIFASNNDSTAYMNINNELIKFKMASTTNEPFTFKDHDLIEEYSSDKYDVTIEAHFEDSTSYESWMFNGKITVKNKSGEHKEIMFVGACGC